MQFPWVEVRTSLKKFSFSGVFLNGNRPYKQRYMLRED
jgi:hypothetical protein